MPNLKVYRLNSLRTSAQAPGSRLYRSELMLDVGSLAGAAASTPYESLVTPALISRSGARFSFYGIDLPRTPDS